MSSSVGVLSRDLCCSVSCPPSSPASTLCPLANSLEASGLRDLHSESALQLAFKVTATERRLSGFGITGGFPLDVVALFENNGSFLEEITGTSEESSVGSDIGSFLEEIAGTSEESSVGRGGFRSGV